MLTLFKRGNSSSYKKLREIYMFATAHIITLLATTPSLNYRLCNVCVHMFRRDYDAFSRPLFIPS